MGSNTLSVSHSGTEFFFLVSFESKVTWLRENVSLQSNQMYYDSTLVFVLMVTVSNLYLSTEICNDHRTQEPILHKTH